MARPCRALHRAFARFVDANRREFAVPLRFTKRTDKVWSFAFEGVTDVLSGWVDTFEVTVAATWDADAWDLILDLDALAERAPGGFVCRICEPDKRVLFPSREALWTDHLFEPFLLWVNDTLAPSPWLELMGTANTSTCARLRREAGQERPGTAGRLPVRYVPVRVGGVRLGDGEDKARPTVYESDDSMRLD